MVCRLFGIDLLQCSSGTKQLSICTKEVFDCRIDSLMFRGKQYVGLVSRRSKSQSVRGHDVLLSFAVIYD